MKLVIVESPAKAKTIEKYLGDGYKVLSSVGHIRDIPKSEKGAIDIEKGFIPNYVIIPGKEKIISDLKKQSKKSEEVLLATDPDREGEAIAWHLKEVLSLKEPKRISFNEITSEAVENAILNPRSIDEDLKQAQEARRVLDRIFGYSLSKLIWKKVRYGLSAGRVQSPALRILMEREREIREFKPEKYYIMQAIFTDKSNEKYETVCEKEITDKKLVERLLTDAKKEKWKIKQIKEVDMNRFPKPPFITSSLQQTANSRLSFSPSRTMRAAQKLYEAGLISYMRTDGVTLSETAHKQIKDVVSSKYGKEYYTKTKYKSRSKNAQEAHEAIRPTDISKTSAGKTEDEKKLYDLIRIRTITSQMRPAVLKKTTVYFESENKDTPIFVIRGVQVKDEGWIIADPESKSKEVIIKKIDKNTDVNCTDISSEEKETTPPNRYSEAGLVKELEKRGIGRPSTYASILRTLVERNYVTKEGRTLTPTELGDVISTFVEKHFKKYINDSFTANMEENLDGIANSNHKYLETISDFHSKFTEAVKSKEDIEKLTNVRPADSKFKCPKCNSQMVIKLAKNGVFMSCDKFPECNGARTESGEEIKEPEEIGKDCPKCKNGKLVSRMGRFGKFVSCNKYPKCKYIEEDKEEAKKSDTGVKCPKCNKGSIREKRGRFGLFYSCSEYPECKFTMRSKPTGDNCSMCQSLMMEGTKTIPTRCSDKVCPMHNPHKLKK